MLQWSNLSVLCKCLISMVSYYDKDEEEMLMHLCCWPWIHLPSGPTPDWSSSEALRRPPEGTLECLLIAKVKQWLCQATSFSGRFKGRLRVPLGTVQCVSWKSNSIKSNMLCIIQGLTQEHDYYFLAGGSKNEGGSLSILRAKLTAC